METIYKGSELGIIEIFRRESGFSQPRTFARRISASEAIVKQIDLYGKLNGHNGCVNTIQFNSSGDLLVSGSDDQKVMFWNWATKTLEFQYPSGHLDNIFQVKIMPFTDDRKVVTTSADGQVRLGLVLENDKVKTKKLGEHQGRVHSLAVEPGSPYVFYSCGEDGFVQHFDLRSNSARKLLSCSSFPDTKQSARITRLNAIVIDPRNPNYFAIGGSDEFARVYDVRKYLSDCSGSLDAPVNTFCPRQLIETRNVHITSLAYSNTSELLVSYNDELVYLFQKNMGIGPSPLSAPHEDLQQLEEPQAYSGHRNSKNGQRRAKLVRVMVGDRHIVNQLEPHPHMPVIATSGLAKNIKLWAPSSNDILPLPHNIQEIMESNRQGREDNSPVILNSQLIMHVLRLHRRQAMAHNGIRLNVSDSESDEGGDEAYILGLSGDDENSSECNIS
ncbi:transducin/WD40 repeat-like superfamily protein [Actinidia rufa]|uniref:Transducin/WD40 repeat-like superfamily protein n=1 Tax=Actinidia rufa TaxID=165716 RepID=A0A7J0H459_9ERIC|nr:transducin/WD40 repeat-like superfamily protein [Actinidia rufa]